MALLLEYIFVLFMLCSVKASGQTMVNKGNNMRQMLMEKLHRFLVESHPDLLVSLQSGSQVTQYLQDRLDMLDDLPEVLLEKGQPLYIAEGVCMEILTRDLQASKYHFICAQLSNSFETIYEDWSECGILVFEVINLIQHCDPVFLQFGFSEESVDDPQMSAAAVEVIDKYVKGEL